MTIDLIPRIACSRYRNAMTQRPSIVDIGKKHVQAARYQVSSSGLLYNVLLCLGCFGEASGSNDGWAENMSKVQDTNEVQVVQRRHCRCATRMRRPG